MTFVVKATVSWDDRGPFLSTHEFMPRGGLSLEGIVAFNDELAALIRAKIPLERGLAAASSDYRGRLGKTIRAVTSRLEAGERLDDALGRATAAMPQIYRAVIEAGIRSGRLAEALQGLSRIGQAQLETRRTIVAAFFYPLVVLGLAYVLFLGCLIEILPRFVAASTELGIVQSPVVTFGEQLRQSIPVWGPVAPLVVLGLVLIWIWAGRSRRLGDRGGLEAVVGWMPGVGTMIANDRAANFADLLAHLIDHDVPLDQAVRLAGNAAGQETLRRTAARWADQLAAGHEPTLGPTGRRTGIPPLIAWMVGTSPRQATLAPGLRHLATAYRRRANRQAESFRVILPGALLVTIGASAVLVYALFLFVPLRGLWQSLALTAQ